MCAQIARRPQLEHILEKLNEARVQKEGRVSWKGFEYEYYRLAFLTCVDLSDKVPPYAKRSIAYGALNSPTCSGKLSSNQIIRDITRREQDYIQLNNKEFILRTWISIEKSPLTQIKIQDAEIYFDESRKFEEIPKNFLENPPFHGKMPNKYLQTYVKFTARTSNEAGFIGIDHLDKLRGLWNCLVGHKYRIISSGPRKPINQITHHPFFTLHDLTGNLVTQKIYYEPNFFIATSNYKFPDINQIRKNTLYFQKKLRKSAFRNIIERNLTRYARALDKIEYEFSIIELWSILEDLCLQGSYDQIIRRASSLYEDYQERAAVLDHIRRERNQLVHSGTFSPDADQIAVQLAEYVQTMLFKYINIISSNFSTKREVEIFLDMPRDAKMLRIGQNFIK